MNHTPFSQRLPWILLGFVLVVGLIFFEQSRNQNTPASTQTTTIINPPTKSPAIPSSVSSANSYTPPTAASTYTAPKTAKKTRSS